MRKIFLFLSFYILFTASGAAFAQESSTVPLTIISPTPPEIKKTIEYDLPYPGILPDNPLYNLKVIRDRFVSFLISDHKKKAEFNLLQADKRLNAGVYLFNKGKNIQAETTISKAENYFFEAVSEIKKANDQNTNTTELTGKLLTASKKHQEVIMSLEKRSKGNIREGLVRERKRAEGFEKQVKTYMLKKAK